MCYSKISCVYDVQHSVFTTNIVNNLQGKCCASKKNSNANQEPMSLKEKGKKLHDVVKLSFVNHM